LKAALFSPTLERHAFGWLLAANLVGVWLAAVLIWPALGNVIAPLTYGRWMPLHLNWQLYGWCSLPLIGILLAWFVTPSDEGRGQVRLALAAWSLALVLGGISWLEGVTSGKLFLDWHGWARAVLPLAMLALWSVLVLHAWSRRAEFSAVARVMNALALLGLLLVPNLLYWSAGHEVYPAINPHSGGATGASLLGSTLGIIAIYGLVPILLRVPLRSGVKPGWWYGLALAGSALVFAWADHGNASHHAPNQIAALAVLLIWVPLLIGFLRRFAWVAAVRPWLRATWVWWTLLVLTGFLTFLPGWSERFKFTNALVAHAHLAMAGLVTSFNLVILRQLRGAGTGRGFWWWQGGCALQVVALWVVGWFEYRQPADLFLSMDWTQALYGVRLAAGIAMLGASAFWWKESAA
jgi:cytochrome c oxidase cbb3-type subunit I